MSGIFNDSISIDDDRLRTAPPLMTTDYLIDCLFEKQFSRRTWERWRVEGQAAQHVYIGRRPFYTPQAILDWIRKLNERVAS